jgi:putative ABC transport system permease protein
MSWRIHARLRALWSWRRRESDLDEEIGFHLSEDAEERVAAGLHSEAARMAATREFGNVTLIRETTREAWGWGGAERAWQDTRYALRMMRRDPGFSAVAILTLALGIAATTAILTVVNALVLRPLPYPDADRLVVLFATTPKQGVSRDTTSFLDFSAWQQSRALSAAAAYRQDPFVLSADGAPEPLEGLRVSHEFLAVLGINPELGRGFTEQEQRGSHPVALISHGLWTRRYGGDPNILTRTIVVDDVNHTVVGVLPPGFQFPAFRDTDLIVPVPERSCRSCGYVRAVARLKPGVAADTAQQELDDIARGLERAFPDSNEGRGVNVVGLQDVATGPVQTPLFVLLGAGVCVLLIGCGNVSSLMLARGIARQQELAVRSALGAGTGRLARQLLTESLSLSFMAASAGAALAFCGSKLLVVSLSTRVPLPPMTFDWRLLVFALLIAGLSGLVSGLGPTVMIWRSDLTPFLKQSGRSQSGGAADQRLRNLLVVAQTALTIVLLVGAGLLMRSFLRLHQVDVGMNARRALTADLMLSRRDSAPPRRHVVVRRLLDTLAAVPGVQAVAVHVDQPFLGGGKRETFHVEGRDDPQPGRGHATSFNSVSGRFFQAMDMPPVRGRVFDAQDTAASPPVAVVNETMAQRFWTGETAVGKRLRFYYDKDPNRWLTIVGVVRDVRYRGRLMEPAPQVFVPGEQPFYRPQGESISVVVRTAGDPAALAPTMRSRIQEADGGLAILKVQLMEQALQAEVAEPRIYTLLLVVFAAIALVIATAGVYGSSAYAVVRRTREIGIRLAMGATPGQIRGLVLRSGMGPSVVGVVIGIAGALGLSRVVSGFLYGVTALDVSTFLTVSLLFVIIAFVAAVIPARRAARIEPTIALRYD